MDRALRRLTLAVFAVKLGTLAVNALTFPRLRAAAPTPERGRVSLLVPARDEAHNLIWSLPPLLAQGALEVILLDDGSRDGTADLARRLGAAVLDGEPLPDGWVGKPWACAQLAREARGDILIFTDADVTWHTGALDAVLAEMRRSGADLLSVFPRQDNRTPGERLVTPVVDDIILTAFPAPLLRLAHPSASAANGQVMAFRGAAYRRLGGHGAVRGEVLDDVAFSRRVKAAGGRLGLALGGRFIGVRMYRSYPESVRGFAKNALLLHGGQRALLVGDLALHIAMYTLPLLRRQWGLVALAWVQGAGVRWLTGRTRPADLLEALLTPLAPLPALPVVVAALQRTTTWKGRTYPKGQHRMRGGSN